MNSTNDDYCLLLPLVNNNYPPALRITKSFSKISAGKYNKTAWLLS